LPIGFSFFTGGSFHAGADKIRAKFGDIRCRKSYPDGAPSRTGQKGGTGGNRENREELQPVTLKRDESDESDERDREAEGETGGNCENGGRLQISDLRFQRGHNKTKGANKRLRLRIESGSESKGTSVKERRDEGRFEAVWEDGVCEGLGFQFLGRVACS
jgi:hypothetical protein